MTVTPMTDQTQQLAPIDDRLAAIRSERFREQLAMALPEGISVDRFARFAQTALLDDASRQRDPAKRLTACEPASLYQALIKCAQDGLMPDGRQAAIVKRGTAAAYMPMVGGLRQISGDHGWTITAHVVAVNDEFEHVEEPPMIVHKPVRPGGDRGAFVACYAVARHRDGRRVQRVLYADEVMKRREVATTKNVWDSWEEQMWEKTAARDVFAELPLDPNDKRVARVIEALTPADAAAALYGPAARVSFGELPSGAHPYVEVPSGADAPTDAVDVPARAVDGDPGGSGGENPSGVASDAALGAPAAAAAAELDEEAVMLAAAAAEYVPPSGSYAENGAQGPLSLSGILDLGDDGRGYLVTALRKLPDGEWRSQVEAFARVEMPAEYAAVTAERSDSKAA